MGYGLPENREEYMLSILLPRHSYIGPAVEDMELYDTMMKTVDGEIVHLQMAGWSRLARPLCM